MNENKAITSIARSRVQLMPYVYIDFMYKKPNLWWRLWQYLLLGWKWEDV